MIERRIEFGPKSTFAAMNYKFLDITDKAKISIYRKALIFIDNFDFNSKPDDSKPDVWTLYQIQQHLTNSIAKQSQLESNIESYIFNDEQR